MKPLYLVPEREGRAELDGPSLLVTLERSAAQRFPLNGLSRVVVGGRIQLQAAAMSAFLEHGVTVTFLGADGSVVGWALPEHTAPSAVNDRLRNLLESPNGRARYNDWRRAAERRAMLGALRRLRVRTPTLVVGDVKEHLERAPWAGAETTEARRWMEWRTGILTSHLAAWLAKLAVDPRLLEADDAGLPLLRDFGEILGWQIYVDLAVAAQRRPLEGDQDGRLAATVAMEHLAQRDNLRIETLWRRFQLWLKGTQ